MRKKLLLLCAVLIGITGEQIGQSISQPAFITDSLDEFITNGMRDWNIPGLSIAVVKDGKVIKSRGYGVRDVKTKAPVDENTLFMIASNSKLFTGTALAQLESNKKFALDDKVSKYIKDYSLYDRNATDLVTFRDLLSHRIGTKTFQGDFIFWNGNLGRRGVVNKMKLLKPTGLFRQNYGYCNSCFVTAGEVIPIVTGKPWEVYVYDSLLMPLGMMNTYMLTQGIEEQDNVAKPYTTQYTGILTELPYDNIDNLGPAGSMVSNVNDMSKWLLMQLDSGRLNGKRIVAWDVLRKTRDSNLSISSRKSSIYPVQYTGYGLGVFMNDYGGKQTYYHTGGAFGFVSNTCFVPESKLGIVILTNNDNQNFFEALRYKILDVYLGVDHSQPRRRQLEQFNSKMNEQVIKTTALKERVKGNEPGMLLDMYTGTYQNDLYGNIVVEKDKSGRHLNIDFKGHNKLKAKLEYMDSNEWLLTYNNIGYGVFPVQFKIDGGKVASIEIRVNEFLDFDAYNFIKKG